MPLLQKVKSKEINRFFFLVKFSYDIWGANNYILPNYQVSEKNLNGLILKGCPICAVLYETYM